jgi:hypothetical protein
MALVFCYWGITDRSGVYLEDTPRCFDTGSLVGGSIAAIRRIQCGGTLIIKNARAIRFIGQRTPCYEQEE